MTDRPLRPLFPEGWACETQVIALVSRADQENDPDVLAVTGASFALSISNIPFPTPIAAVRVGLSPEGTYLINPTYRLETSRLDLVAGSEEAIVMVEAGANEISEEEMLEGAMARPRRHPQDRRGKSRARWWPSWDHSPPVPARGARSVRERLEQDWRSVWPPPSPPRQAEELCGRGRPQGRDAGQLRRR